MHALCREMATRRWCFHADLGTLMNRHSTVVSYLHMLLAAVCGRLCVAGGDVIPGTVMPIGSNSDERDPKTWRTVATNFPAIMGTFPPNVLPEEILSGHDERPRAVIVSGSNPLRSYADTRAYEEAFGEARPARDPGDRHDGDGGPFALCPAGPVGLRELGLDLLRMELPGCVLPHATARRETGRRASRVRADLHAACKGARHRP